VLRQVKETADTQDSEALLGYRTPAVAHRELLQEAA
jgi:hypothetical protein